MNTNKIQELFKSKLTVINMGLESFGDNLRKTGVEVIQMQWRPPAGGNEKLLKLLAQLEQ